MQIEMINNFAYFNPEFILLIIIQLKLLMILIRYLRFVK